MLRFGLSIARLGNVRLLVANRRSLYTIRGNFMTGRFHVLTKRTKLRSFGTGTSLVPKGFIFRAFWTGMTAAVGYVYYQVSQATSWVSEKAEILKGIGLETVGELLSIWSLVTAASAVDTDGKGESWNPFKWRQRTKDEHHQSPASNGTNVGDNDKDTPGVNFDEGQHHEFRDFIKKMIEVRNILKTAEMDADLNLPSIVVIGSQSSGKSSVLESIVGQEFLPKGNNMVTKRPLELTLVNSPSCPRDYAVFSQLEIGPVYDFSEVQKRLEELNEAVPSDQWISPKPIELTIYSKNVPDLSLVDLPGYIQVTNKSQPPILHDKIATLCQRYIERNSNIILAVCAADVDLANAEALKAARAVDPNGDRTIGVLTKLDLVDPGYAAEIIKNDNYPLRLGYVGVICKAAHTMASAKTLMLSSSSSSTSSTVALSSSHQQSRFEDGYIREHEEIFQDLRNNLGIGCLRNKLTSALEHLMSQSLLKTLLKVQDELTEIKYSLKVEFNDRSISPEAYVSCLAGSVKSGLESVAREYNKAKVRSILRALLEERLLSVSTDYIWEYYGNGNGNGSNVGSSVTKGQFNEARLEMAIDQLTRSGVGRIVANGLVDAIMTQAKSIIRDGPLSHHPAATEKLLLQVDTAMRVRSQSTIEQVENAIKPLKHDFDFTDDEWVEARQKLSNLFTGIEGKWNDQVRAWQAEIGLKRLKKIVQKLSENVNEKEVAMMFNPMLVNKVKDLVSLTKQLKLLQSRMQTLQRPACERPLPPSKTADGQGGMFDISSWLRFGGSKGQLEDYYAVPSESIVIEGKVYHQRNACQTACPEIFLYLTMEKLLTISTLHAHHELVHEFLHPFSDELASSLPSSRSVASSLDRNEIMQFIKENPTIYRHFQLQERKRVLERVKDKLQYLHQQQQQQQQQQQHHYHNRQQAL